MLERYLFFTALFVTACGDKADKNGSDSGVSSDAGPKAQITAPSAGEVIKNGELYVARGTVSDPDDNTGSLLVHWFIGDEEIPRECHQGIHPDSEGLTQCDVSFSFDKQFIRLRVEDNDGNSAEDTVPIELEEASAPTVVITEPISNSEYRETDLITFSGTVSDGEDQPEGLSVFWDSDVQGLLDIGNTVDSDGNVRGAGTLNTGNHTIRLWAEDTSGRSTSAETYVYVFPAQAAPTVSITAPDDGAVFTEGELVLIEATVVDERDQPDELTVQWSSNIDLDLGTTVATSDGKTQLGTSTLSVGSHLIIVIVTDTDGDSASENLVIEVTEASPEDD